MSTKEVVKPLHASSDQIGPLDFPSPSFFIRFS
jgi:hypothetical protein